MTRGWPLVLLSGAVVVVAWLLLSWAFEAPSENVQVTWTCLGLVGALITGANLLDAWIDLKVLHTSGRNGDLRVVARSGVRSNGLRLIQMGAVIFAGVLSLWHGPTLRLTDAQREALHIQTWTTLSIIITSCIGIVVVIAVVQAILDRRDRLELYAHRGVPRDRR